MMGASIIAIVGAALVGALIGQSSLNLTARNLTAAMSDATRVMEAIRSQNTLSACASSGIPSIVPPNNLTSWDQWLEASKSIPVNSTTPFELVAVTCQDASAIICHAEETVQCPDGQVMVCPSKASGYPITCNDGTKAYLNFAPYCGAVRTNATHPAQVGMGEWAKVAANTQYNPIQVTVAVGWVQGGRAASGQDFVFTKGGTRGSGKLTVTTADKFETNDTGGDGIITSPAMLSAAITCR